MARLGLIQRALRQAYREARAAGVPDEITHGYLRFGREGMTPAARAARAAEGGYQRYFHGSSDLRPVRESGRFEPRTRQHRSFEEDGSYGSETVEQPVYLARERSTAASYADPQRAWDWQNAEPGVLEARVRENNLMRLDAGGARFRDVDLQRVRSQIPQERQAEFDALVARHADPTRSNLGTGDLEIIAQRMGFDGFRLDRVRDTYTGGGRPGTIVATRPSTIRSSDATFDPRRRHWNNLLAATTAGAPIGLLALLARRNDEVA